jgi:hypothetical protein
MTPPPTKSAQPGRYVPVRRAKTARAAIEARRPGAARYPGGGWTRDHRDHDPEYARNDQPQRSTAGAVPVSSTNTKGL